MAAEIKVATDKYCCSSNDLEMEVVATVLLYKNQGIFASLNRNVLAESRVQGSDWVGGNELFGVALQTTTAEMLLRSERIWLSMFTFCLHYKQQVHKLGGC